MEASPLTTRPTAWAPLGFRVYRLLWLAVLVSNLGTWMQLVGAQWLLVNLPHAATLVALVQTADTLPDLLLALPGGALADIFDRRRFLIGLQWFQIAVGAGLTVLTLAGQMTPPLLLGFTFLLGAAGAIETPAYQALIPELVPREQIAAAAALGGVNINLARAIGPALAGLLIARLGVGWVFALNTISFVFIPVVLLGWRRQLIAGAEAPERFLPALRAGGRYVRHDPVSRRILLRLGLFIAPATAIWALLPLLATQRLHMSAGGYGLLLGGLGAGAILGALVLPSLSMRLTPNPMLFVAAAAYAVATIAVVLVQRPLLAFLALLPAGAAWMAVISSSNAEMQLFLPQWVRARGLATYQMVLFGSQALGAIAWGVLAQYAGLPIAFLVAAALLFAGAATLGTWPLLDTRGLDRAPSLHWPEPNLTFEPAPETPVAVATMYTVAPDLETRFLAAMQEIRLSRLRTGAIGWRLYREGETARVFVETYFVATWEEHLRQHHGRLTGADAVIDRRARELSDPKPSSKHWFLAEPEFRRAGDDSAKDLTVS
ncbi:MAG TPA: MFS transporter [Gemmatimonadales bacterium]|nr:MFS transporter [Gemmatimonadales bacterium]